MRYRACFTFLLFAAATACATATESPTAPPSLAVVSNNGEPPPPPVDTGDIVIDGGSGEFSFQSVSARYFANKTGNNAWLAFESGQFVLASPGARLQYHENSGRTNGNGVLTDLRTGATLDLARVIITAGHFGACDGDGSVIPGKFPLSQGKRPDSTMIPAIAVPCPPRNLVAEWTTISAPCSSGRQR